MEHGAGGQNVLAGGDEKLREQGAGPDGVAAAIDGGYQIGRGGEGGESREDGRPSLERLLRGERGGLVAPLGRPRR